MTWRAEPGVIAWGVRGTQRTARRTGSITVYDNWNSLTEGQAVVIAAALNNLEHNSPEHAGVVFRAEGEPTDVHTEHCCLLHGCKYGDDNCTVVTKQLRQSSYCESCVEPRYLRVKT